VLQIIFTTSTNFLRVFFTCYLFSSVEICFREFLKNGKTVDEWDPTCSDLVAACHAPIGYRGQRLLSRARVGLKARFRPDISCRSPQSPRRRRARAAKPPVFIGSSPRPPSSSPERVVFHREAAACHRFFLTGVRRCVS
jgi:hypothetical protein